MSDGAQKLNAQQRKAVEHDSGPLMVLAGPGTGKTRVIAHRIAHLIDRRAVEPESIVALTYTVKAAAQLRERLHGLVGERAERINAHTIHGLGHRIVRRFADEAGVSLRGFGERSGGGGIIDSAQQKRMLRSIVLENNLFAHPRAEGLDAVVGQVIDYAATLGNAAITPEQAARFCAEANDRLDRAVDWQGNALDAEAVAAERVRVSMLADAARAIDLFAAARRADGLLTFDDLITLPIRILSEGKHAAAILRDECRHIVVDEFQDANTAQIELLRLLMPSGGASRDLCVVGDDDQSIYEFRGADDRAFHHFKRIWPDAARIDLSDNYRSTPSIVAVANSVMGKAPARFAPDKVVRAAAGAPGAPPVECVGLENDQQSGEVIAAMILTDKAAHPERPWSKYAVVARFNLHIDRILATLRIEGIPAIADREASSNQEEGVRDMLAWVEALAMPHETAPVHRLLIRPPVSMDPKLVQSLHTKYRARLSRFQTGDPGAIDPGGFIDWIAADLPDDAGAARLITAHNELRAFAAAHPAHEVLARIVSLAGVAHADLLPASERVDRVGGLVALLRFARARQERLDPPGDIRAFWSYWDDLDDKERSLNEANPTDRIDGVPEEPSEKEDAVRLITAHSAKGLEFDTVFVPNITPSSGYGRVRDRDGPDLPGGLLRQDDPRSVKERVGAEERRVFYVAATRAERRLVLMAKRNKSRSKSMHLYEEVVYDATLDQFRIVREGMDLIRSAAERNLGRGFAWAIDADGRLDSEVAGFKAQMRRRETFERARRDLRVAAAAALDAPTGAADPREKIEQSASTLRHAAAGLAALAHAEQTGVCPKWADEFGVGETVRAILARVARPESEDDNVVPSLGLRSPLSLSFTQIEQYERCPACYYLKHVLGLEPVSRREQIVGTVVHKTLERFCAEFRGADTGEGAAPPGSKRLLAIGREEFFRASPRHREADRAQLDQVMAQLNLFMDRLHDSRASILEIEKRIEHKHGPHKFTSKIDRIDQITGADGRAIFRIVDYKTGVATTKLLQPKADDLQMGIYALALAHHFSPAEPRPQAISGVAEYWITSTGQRGTIDLGALKYDKILARIDKAIAGMLGGRWASAKDCKGDCSIIDVQRLLQAEGGSPPSGEPDTRNPDWLEE